MAVDQGLALNLGKGEILRLLLEKFAEEKNLPRQLQCFWIVGKQVDEFVAKHGCAAWLKDNDRNFVSYLSLQLLHRAAQKALGTIQHSKVVKRTATADTPFRNSHLESRCFQHFNRSDRGFGMKIIIEGVRPENHRGRIGLRRLAFLEPTAKIPGRKSRNA